MRVGSYVLVHWRDACGGAGWHSLKGWRREALKRSKMTSFGKLIEITNEYLIIAAGQSVDGLLERPGFIPLSLVLSIDRVNPVRMKRKKRGAAH